MRVDQIFELNQNPPNLSLAPVAAGLLHTTAEMESIPTQSWAPASSFLDHSPGLGFPRKFTPAPEFLNPLLSTSVQVRGTLSRGVPHAGQAKVAVLQRAGSFSALFIHA